VQVKKFNVKKSPIAYRNWTKKRFRSDQSMFCLTVRVVIGNRSAFTVVLYLTLPFWNTTKHCRMCDYHLSF